MNKMYECFKICKCAKCQRIKINCAECKLSVAKTKECADGGIKECENFVLEDNLQKLLEEGRK